MLDSKDKKKASLPQSKVVRKPNVGVVGVSSSRTLHPSGGPVSPSQSSYSGLGPGRGGAAGAPSRPQSPLKTPAPVQRPPCSSSLHPSQHKSYQAPKAAVPKPPVNTEIMKKSLRFVKPKTDCGLVRPLIKCKVTRVSTVPPSTLTLFILIVGTFIDFCLANLL